MAKPNPMGATFAERKAAAEGKSSFVDPTPAGGEVEENSSFASRAGKPAAKQVKSADVEDKAVTGGESKAPAKKAPAKKA